ncbi:thiamine pyrophosphate-dependent enzyme [Adlercreutzia faecimuris]|uniref:Thiamine pyrophosphate-dependent enzyme n=1 Tax=Adlercreutzia faecimuris TaxID=2897341 RepID=A0ABS9WDC3_9ACTN|nr:thiamine pyrophosphate-dependent enzyme [Adlercreutzia sp. JBNU-10]MCI2240859.1 thiamine pyrophosphate-dependent enzyme [Adlercreutzia sp. JBNU-10]
MKQLLMGNEAFAHAALEAGVRVVAGYPGTPSSELVETVAKRHAQGAARGVHVEWSTNEKAALEVLAGAAYCGARTLFTCKMVGLNVASDALLSLNYVGVRGGTVLFVADDPGPISSQTEQDTRRFGAFAKVPVLDPATPEQGYAMMKAAFDLSERYGTPVIVRPTTRISHASAFFDVPDQTEARPVPEGGFDRDPRWVIFPKRAWEAHGEINRRLDAIARDYGTDPVLAAFNPVEEGGDAQTGASGASAPLGIVAGGVSAAYTREALALIAREAACAGVPMPPWRLMQVGTPYPFPADVARAFAEGLDEIVVFEELDSVLEEGLLALAGRDHAAWRVRGRLTGDARDRGENDAEDIARRLARLLDEAAARAAGAPDGRPALVDLVEAALAPAGAPAYDGPLPVRPPVLCAGCPHRGSFYAVKRALGKRPAVLCGDIGCYTLGNAAPLDAVDTCLCMGAGITIAQGMAVADPAKKAVAFVGDSTFFASGLTGIANAVYNGHDITVAALDNATTAMTGSQPHPGTGVTLMGPRRDPIDIEGVLRALGVRCITVADPLDRAAAQAAAAEAIDFEGPSAVIFRSPCIQLTKPAPALAVDADRCTGCKKCITEIGCPGIGFSPDAVGPKSGARGQAFVDASLCNGCGLCAQICPFDALGAPAGEGAPAPEKGGSRD